MFQQNTLSPTSNNKSNSNDYESQRNQGIYQSSQKYEPFQLPNLNQKSLDLEQNNSNNRKLFKNVSQLILSSSQVNGTQIEQNQNNQSYIEDYNNKNRKNLNSQEKKQRNDMIVKWITGSDNKKSLKEILNQFEGQKEDPDNGKKKRQVFSKFKQDNILEQNDHNNDDIKYNIAQKYFQNHNDNLTRGNLQQNDNSSIKKKNVAVLFSGNPYNTQEDEILEDQQQSVFPKIVSSEQSIYIPSCATTHKRKVSDNLLVSSFLTPSGSYQQIELQQQKKGILKRPSYLINNSVKTDQSIIDTKDNINHRKTRSLLSNKQFIIGEAKKVNFKETLRVIELESGTERQDIIKTNFTSKLYKKRTQSHNGAAPIIIDSNY